MKNNLYISNKILLRNKKIKISILITIFLMILIVIIGSYKTTEDKNLNEDFQKNPYYKYLDVQKINTNEDPNHEITKEEYEETKKELLTINHIVTVVNSSFFATYADLKNSDKSIHLYAVSDSSLNILKGKNINYNSNENEMICPINFSPLSSKINKFTKAEYINLEDKIDSKIELTYKDAYSEEEYQISIKLVGLYENNPTQEDDICYTTESVTHEIDKNEFSSEEEYTGSSRFEYNTSSIIQIDDIDNIEYVKNELNKKNYTYEETYLIDEEVTNTMYKKIYYFTIFIFIIYILFTTQMIIKNYKEVKNNLVILKYLGYEKKDLKRIYVFNNMQILLMSFTIVLFLTLLFKLIVNKILYYYPYLLGKQILHIDLSYLFIALFINLIIIIVYGNIQIDKKKHKKIKYI